MKHSLRDSLFAVSALLKSAGSRGYFAGLGVLMALGGTAHGQFTAGRIVVLQAGDGSSALAATGNPIVLKEFTPAGAAGISVTVPSTGATPMIMAGNSTTEGNLSLAGDGQRLVFAGYAQTLPNATALAASSGATINRAVGTVDANGVFTRQFVSSTLFSAGNPRGATSEGTNYWGSGSNQGVNYFGPGTAATIATGKTNLRAAGVFNNQLYVSSASAAGAPAVTGVFAVGSGLPTATGQTLATVVNSAATTNGFYFNSTTTVLYVATGVGVEKWTFSGTWSLAYTMTYTGGASAVIADFSGAQPLIYAVNPTGTQLVTFTDPNAGSGSVPVTTTLLATAPTLTAFRSLAFAPQSGCTAPAIGLQPDDATVCPGGFATFTISATGTATLAYQWRHNTNNLADGGNISGANTDTLSVNPVAGADAGSYDCVVTNACGSATSDPATLTVPTTDADGDGTPDCADGCPLDPNKTAPGICGCGVADTDTDGDGTPDCNDGCPLDPNKLAPGICGCGVADTDTDGDGTPDCNDGCPLDPNKLAPGICGCGVADTDTDGDGTADCNDGCPLDPNKLAPGICGCGVADTDTDGDGTADCNDGCPLDPNKTAPGQCGCGVADTDTDGDGTADCNDGCPTDPNKIEPGICGCNVTGDDTDGDGTPDCNDGCPLDPLKILPGQCGCGVADTDTDGDGTADCNDLCPNDPLKVAPGQCGCGVPDTDTDGDGTADCNDGCPADPLKTAPGICGCGVADTDTDGDGTADCNDGCSADPLKTAPGICGCGVADTDTDGDGTADCDDGCPNDPLKVAPGQCGCGVTDTDTDGDGTADCNDGCPNDPLKVAPGQCGCGVPDTDTDGDGTADCNDGCPLDPNKTAPGICGCGVADTDTDGDGTADCNDGCPTDPNKTAPGICGCGVADTDTDGDGTLDCNDGCPSDPNKTAPGFCGCGNPDTDSDFNGLADCLEATLSELLFNPPGTDNTQEFVEIRGVPGASLGSFFLLAIEGDVPASGVLDVVYPLTGASLGTNGLLLVRDSAGVIAPGPDAGTNLLVGDFSPDIENGSNTYILGFGTPPAGGTDLDIDNDGTLNAGALSGFTVVDAVGVLENDATPVSNVGYGDDVGFLNLGPFASHTPDGLVRIYNANGSACNWNGGDSAGTNPGGPYSFNAINNFGFADHGLDLVVTPVQFSPGGANLLPDADGDGFANACDSCTDTDGDGFGDPGFPSNTCALDGCPTDPNKSDPDVCGCGVADTDTDGDGTADCIDGCPTDPFKIAPGICGCGVADTDTDGDGTADCNDGCPTDPNKVAPGICGCGVVDTDTDGDGTADCIDGCPSDPNKVAPGICGCGVADTDTDGDGTADCNDGCPLDPNKLAPGICGCGVVDTDTDGDGAADCIDGCPTDPNKVAPGICGCGVADTDTDGDGAPDCNDGCPTDPNKVAPGICGCGTADTDSDGDGTVDCFDGCPTDPNKIAPGACGCGVADVDTDGDGALDCNDQCPTDPAKILKGLCGCFVPEGCSLGIDINEISAASGGVQKFFLYGGAGNALLPHLLVGSLSGTSPGISLGTVLLPLNVDSYTVYTYTNPNKPPYANTLGVLNLFGFSLAKLTLPSGLALSGLPFTVNHAYVLIDPSPLTIVFASNAVGLTIAP